MTRPDRSDLTALWQEQVDPHREEAALRVLAKEIERSALRRRRIDFSLGAAALAVIGFYMVSHPAYWWVLLTGGVIALGTIWVRHRLHEAARALFVRDPERYCEAALEHARVELNFSMAGLLAFYPTILLLMLMMRLTETGSLGLAIDEFFTTHLARLLLATVASAGIILIFLADNRRLRDHIRRLEALDRERKAEEARDLTDEG